MMEMMHNIGWTIVHSFWEIALISGIAILLIRCFTWRSAATRYMIAYMAMVVSFMSVGITYFLVSQHNLPSPSVDWSISFSSEISAEASNDLLFIPSGITGDWAFWVSAVWVVGFVCMLVKHVIGLIYIRKLKNNGLHEVTGHWSDQFVQMVKDVGIDRHIRLYYSQLVRNPLTFGTIKPIVLVPVGFFSELSPEEVEAILMHELAHIRRHDYLLNLIQRLISAVLFYHPGIWLLNNYIDLERENACDDFAVGRMKDSNHLVRALGLLQIRNFKTQNRMAMNVLSNKSDVLHRIRRLTNRKTEKLMASSLLLPVFVLLLGVLLASFQYKQESDFGLIPTPAPIENHSLYFPIQLSPYGFHESQGNYEIQASGDGNVPYGPAKDAGNLVFGPHKNAGFTAYQESAIDTSREEANTHLKVIEKERKALELEKEQLKKERKALAEARRQLALEVEKMNKERLTLHEELNKVQSIEELKLESDLMRSIEKQQQIIQDQLDPHLRAMEEKVRRQSLAMEELANSVDLLELQDRIRLEEAEIRAQLAEAKLHKADQLRKLAHEESYRVLNFRKALFDELVKDKIISSTDIEKLEIRISEKGISFNGKDLDNKLLSKYRKLLKKYGIEPDDSDTITFHQ